MFFSSTKLENKEAEQILQEVGDGGKVAQTMHTHVSKCKNYKVKKIQKSNFETRVSAKATQEKNGTKGE
jgi:hypothetical protein